MFRLLRLKPPNGWDAVGWELAIVTLGVLIALAAQQAVDDWQWRGDVRQTRQDLAEEMAGSLASVMERKMVAKCLRGQIDLLIGALREPGARWRGRPMPLSLRTYVEDHRPAPSAYRAPVRPWTATAWERSNANGVLNHFPDAEVAGYSQIYASLETIRGYQDDEKRTSPSLLYLSFDGEVDRSARLSAIATLGMLRGINQNIVEEGDQLIAKARALPVVFAKTSLPAQVDAFYTQQRRFRGSCVEAVAADL